MRVHVPGHGILYIQTNLICEDLFDAIFVVLGISDKQIFSQSHVLPSVFVIQTCSLHFLPGAASAGHSGG